MQQEVVLALLAKEPSHGYELRARLDEALDPLGEGLNAAISRHSPSGKGGDGHTGWPGGLHRDPRRRKIYTLTGPARNG